jgi:hypothetical protein
VANPPITRRRDANNSPFTLFVLIEENLLRERLTSPARGTGKSLKLEKP